MKHLKLVVCLAMACAGTGYGGDVAEVVIQPERRAAEVSPLLFGTQFEFYGRGDLRAISDPASWRQLQQLAPTLLRFPGGTCAYHYIWWDTARSWGPVWATPPERLSTQEFLDLCQELGVQSLLQVNTMLREGKPRGPIPAHHDFLNPQSLEEIESAAETMAYEWARSLAEKSAGVVNLWQIGNEDWTYYRAEEYAQAVPIYVAALRRVNADARIIAVGLAYPKTGPWTHDWLSADERAQFATWKPWWSERIGITNERDAWNPALTALPPGTFDLLSLHLYPYGQGDDTVEHYRSLLVSLDRDLEEPLDYAHNFLEDTGHQQVNLAVTEYATDLRTSVPGGGSSAYMPAFYYTLANGIATADAIGRLVERSPWVEIGVLHSLFTMGTTWLWPEQRLINGVRPLEHPTWKALALWRHHTRARLCRVRTRSGGTVSTPGGPVPALVAWGTSDDDGCSLVVVHRDPEKPLTLTIALRAPWASEALPAAQLLSGPEPSATNWEYDETGSYPVDTRVVELATVREGCWCVELPPLSVLGVQWEH